MICNWSEHPYPFGPGLLTVTGDFRVWEIIPYASPDGSGDVAGFAVRADRGIRLVRCPGSIDVARGEAERMIHEACGG